jgi:hypothetical protein
MRRVLLGSTALVAAGLIAGGAAAAEKIKLGVGGYYNTAYGIVSEDDDSGEAGDNRRNQAINSDAEVHFKGSTVLDNGIEVGTRIELEGFTSGDQIDERWAFFRGGFGELRFGDDDDARKQKSYSAPTPTPNSFGVNSPFFTFNNLGAGHVTSSVSTFRNLENDSAKIIYFTPSLAGAQLAVSYAPDGTQDRTGFGTPLNSNCGQVSEALSIGGDFAHDANGLTISGGGGYSRGEREDGCPAGVSPGDDPSIVAVGLNIGFGAIVVGGSVLFAQDTIVGNDDSTEFDVGVTYTVDAVTVGAGWGHGIYDVPILNAGDDTLDHAQVGGSYAVGPGITIDGFIGYFDYNSDAGLSNNGWQAGVASTLGF